MNRLYKALKAVLCCCLAAFAAFGIYTVADYRLDAVKYATDSAPWYLGIQIAAVLTAAAAVILLVAMAVVRRKQQRV